MSVVAPIFPVLVPPLRLKTTADPPVVRKFPAASLAVKVRVTVFPDCTVPADTLLTDVTVEITPGFTVIVGSVVVMAEPAIFAVTVVADPLTTPVKVEV